MNYDTDVNMKIRNEQQYNYVEGDHKAIVNNNSHSNNNTKNKIIYLYTKIVMQSCLVGNGELSKK